jgi:dihydropteroate synthase
MGYLFGASIFRVHAVAPTRDALAMAHALSAN